MKLDMYLQVRSLICSLCEVVMTYPVVLEGFVKRRLIRVDRLKYISLPYEVCDRS